MTENQRQLLTKLVGWMVENRAEEYLKDYMVALLDSNHHYRALPFPAHRLSRAKTWGNRSIYGVMGRLEYYSVNDDWWEEFYILLDHLAPDFLCKYLEDEISLLALEGI